MPPPRSNMVMVPASLRWAALCNSVGNATMAAAAAAWEWPNPPEGTMADVLYVGRWIFLPCRGWGFRGF